VIQIEVENANPAIATDIAKEWATLFVEYRQQKTPRHAARTVLRLRSSTSNLWTRPAQLKINTLAGGIMGLLIGPAIVFVLEYLRRV
jgi:capsular polysaccharide biosynthesis protein